MNHIARDGETEYAALYRKRSGQDAGCIEFGISVSSVDLLPQSEKLELVRVAQQLIESLKRYCV